MVRGQETNYEKFFIKYFIRVQFTNYCWTRGFYIYPDMAEAL